MSVQPAVTLWMDNLQNANGLKDQCARPVWVKHGVGKLGPELGPKEQELQGRSALLNSIKTCGKQKNLCTGSRIHTDIIRNGSFLDTGLGSALISMYAKCGALAEAQHVFDELPVRTIISWNSLISGYTHQGLGDEALTYFGKMQGEGLHPDAVTFASILKACGAVGSIKKGEEIHEKAERQGMLKDDIVLVTALIDMYGKCGDFAKAQAVFDQLSVRDVASWTALISGYVQHGMGNEALNCFQRMKADGLSADIVTLACVSKACASIQSVEKGDEVLAEVRKKGLLKKSVMLGTSLVDMYAKCGELTKAQDVFDQLSIRNVVSWNALIAGYVQHGHAKEALKCFRKMQDEDFSPDAVTFASVLKACGMTGSVENGEEIHAEVRKQGLLDDDLVLGTSLVDMYVKCGAVARAQDVFDRLPVHNVASWTALISGYTQVAQVEMVFMSFRKMVAENIVPDDVTFVTVLSACSHAGLVEEGQMYFSIMIFIYFLTANLEHYTCMVDLFSRAGHFDKALFLIKKVPSYDCLPLWLAVLGGCRKWGNVKLARMAFEHVKQLDENYASAHVSMSNIYAAAGMHGDAVDTETKIEALGFKSGASKMPDAVLGLI